MALALLERLNSPIPHTALLLGSTSMLQRYMHACRWPTRNGQG